MAAALDINRASAAVRRLFGANGPDVRIVKLSDAPSGESYLHLLALRVIREMEVGKLSAETARRFLDAKAEYEAPVEIAPPALITNPRPGFVYFIQSGAAVKIGFTTALAKRLDALSTSLAEPPSVLLVEPGTVADERAYHRRFAVSRMRMEWFRLEGEVAEFLRSVP
jgi:hypothetical protein